MLQFTFFKTDRYFYLPKRRYICNIIKETMATEAKTKHCNKKEGDYIAVVLNEVKGTCWTTHI